MATMLEHILQSTAPARTIVVYRQRARRALDAWEPANPNTGDYKEFQPWMADLHCLLENTIRPITPPRQVHAGLDWACARRAFVAANGPDAVEKALGMIATGEGHRLHPLIEAMATNMADECARNEIRSRVTYYLAGLTENERVAVGFEYIRASEFWSDLQRHPLDRESILGNVQGLLERHSFEMWKFEQQERHLY